MNLQEVMTELEQLGSAQTRKIMRRHGAPEAIFGVKVGDMKKIVRKIKVDQPLAEQLFETGNVDAQYFAGLIADPGAFTPELLDHWAETSAFTGISMPIVAALAAESGHGIEMGCKWIESGDDKISATGWTALNHTMSITPDEDLDISRLDALLDGLPDVIHSAQNKTRNSMNTFVIGAGSFVAPLTEKALSVAQAIGRVEVDVGQTSCKVPLATDYINKVVGMGRQGKKRKAARC